MFKGKSMAKLSSIDSIQFMKSGAKIADQARKTQVFLAGKIEEKKKEIEEIAQKRGVDAQEIIDAGTDEEKIFTYSSKISAGLPQNRDILSALNEDLHKLRSLAETVSSLTQKIGQLGKIAEHVEPARDFDLTFDELEELGF